MKPVQATMAILPFSLLVVLIARASSVSLDPGTAELITCRQHKPRYSNSISIQCSPKDRPHTVISFSSYDTDGPEPTVNCSREDDPKRYNYGTVYCEHDQGYFSFTLHRGGGISINSVGGASIINGGGVIINGGNIDIRGGFGSSVDGTKFEGSDIPPVKIPPVNIPPVVIPPIPPVVIPPIPAVRIPAIHIPSIPAVNIPAVYVPPVHVGSTRVDNRGGNHAGSSYDQTATNAVPSNSNSENSYGNGVGGDVIQTYPDRPSAGAATGSGWDGERAPAGNPDLTNGRRHYVSRSPSGAAVFTTTIDGNPVHVVLSASGASVVTVNVNGREVSAATSASGNRAISGHLPGVNMDAFFNRILQYIY